VVTTDTNHDVRESNAYFGEYLGNVVKITVVEVHSADAAGGLKAPTALKRIQRPRAVQLQRVTLDLRQTFHVLC